MAYRRSAAVQQRLDNARATIVDAAHALVAEHGYAGCAVAAVADRAGVATGTVYRHFPTKGALVTEVFRAASGREVAAVRAAAARPGSAADRAVAGVRTFANRALRAPRLAYALLAEPVDPEVDAERLVFRRAYQTIFTSVVKDGIAAGELPDQDAEVSAAGVVGAIAETLVVPLAAGQRVEQARHTVDELARFVVRALGRLEAAPRLPPRSRLSSNATSRHDPGETDADA